eukprot:gene6252-12657_t
MLEIIHLNSNNSYGIKTESALYFGPLNGENLYHLLFEEMIPMYEILKNDLILSTWLNEINTNDSTIKLLFAESTLSNLISEAFLKRFFPHVDYSFHIRNNTRIKKNINSKIYLVDYLVAGSNHSCVHYGHCSRSDYQTPFIASEFRKFIFSQVGINNTYRKSYNFNNYSDFDLLHENNNLNNLTLLHHKRNHLHFHHRPPRIVIIQRSKTRRISNTNEIISMILNITNITPLLLDYGKMTLDEQIKRTFSTDILIMVHGGALGNTLYLPPYATLIDIYPYTFVFQLNPLTNWVRYALRDIPIAHAPFDIIDPFAMAFGPRNFKLPLCVQDPLKIGEPSAILYWRVKHITVDIDRFRDHFIKEYKKWKFRTNYIPPMSREEFSRDTASFTEPWYLETVRNRNENKSALLRTCFDILKKQMRWH